MHVSNELDFGHLVNPESYDVSRTHPDMYQLFDNKIEWEQRYLHEDYAASFQEGYKPLMVMSALDMTWQTENAEFTLFIVKTDFKANIDHKYFLNSTSCFYNSLHIGLTYFMGSNNFEPNRIFLQQYSKHPTQLSLWYIFVLKL